MSEDVVLDTPPARLIVVGGSSADGFGVAPHSSYASILSEELGLRIATRIRPGLILAHCLDLMEPLQGCSTDTLILHPGLVDMRLWMPRSWHRWSQFTQRGRGQVSLTDIDRRLWSRARRRFGVSTEQSLNGLARRLNLRTPRTPLGHYHDSCVEVARKLGVFPGAVLVVISARSPDGSETPVDLARAYTELLRNSISTERRRSPAPTIFLGLSEVLDGDDYLDDGFHPNDQGHLKIARACLNEIQNLAPSSVN